MAIMQLISNARATQSSAIFWLKLFVVDKVRAVISQCYV